LFGKVMDGLRQPSRVCFEGNVSENWKRFRRSFENYLMAIDVVLVAKGSPIDPEPAGNAAISRRQIAMFLHIAGDETNEIFSQLEAPVEKSKTVLSDVQDIFDTYCNPRKNELYEWFVFWSMSQTESEPIDVYLKRLKSQASRCDFPEGVKSKMLLCRIVFGLTSVKLKERLLHDNTMALEKAVEDIRATEMTEAKMSLIADGDKFSLAMRQVATVVNKPIQKGGLTTDKKIKCRFCSYEHVYGKCPAYGKKCNSNSNTVIAILML